MYNIDGGDKNTAIGYAAGYNITTGTGNIFIGHKAGMNSSYDTESNKLVIGNDTSVELIVGDMSSNYVTINGNLNTHNIRPVTDNTYSLGTAALRWDNAFFDDGYIEINADGATTNLAGEGRFWVSGTTP